MGKIKAEDEKQTADIIWPAIPEDSFNESEHVHVRAEWHGGMGSQDIRYFLSPWSAEVFTKSWPTLFFCPVTLQSFILAAFCQISLDRGHLLRDKKGDEKEKRCLYSDWGSWLSKSFSCKYISSYRHLCHSQSTIFAYHNALILIQRMHYPSSSRTPRVVVCSLPFPVCFSINPSFLQLFQFFGDTWNSL